MTPHAERLPALKESPSLQTILTDIPHAVDLARIEAESSELAHSPEGLFVLTYLLAARNVIKPVLTQSYIHQHLLQPTGGHSYNPQRTIDEIGIAIADYISKLPTDMHNFWIRTEENPVWSPGKPGEGFFEEADRFVFIDPIDETSAIPKGKRLQTSGIGIYNRDGELQGLGVISLVDDGIIFYAKNDSETVYTYPPQRAPEQQSDAPIRFATLTRRMHALNNLPIASQGGEWTMDTVGGYGVCAMLNGTVDAMLDPVKGNPWFEYILWGPAAEKAGFVVTDPDGEPIDTASIVKYAIAKNPDDSYRIKFVISNNPETHKRILRLLTPSNTPPAQ